MAADAQGCRATRQGAGLARDPSRRGSLRLVISEIACSAITAILSDAEGPLLGESAGVAAFCGGPVTIFSGCAMATRLFRAHRESSGRRSDDATAAFQTAAGGSPSNIRCVSRDPLRCSCAPWWGPHSTLWDPNPTLKALQPLRGWHRVLHARASGVLSFTVTRAIQDILVSSLRTFHFGWRGVHARRVHDFQAVATYFFMVAVSRIQSFVWFNFDLFFSVSVGI